MSPLEPRRRASIAPRSLRNLFSDDQKDSLRGGNKSGGDGGEPGDPSASRSRDPFPFSLNTLMMIGGFMLLASLLFGYWKSRLEDGVDYSFFLQQVDKDTVASIEIQGLTLHGTWKDPRPANHIKEKMPNAPDLVERFRTEIPMVESRSLLDRLDKHDVKYRASNAESPFSMSMLLELFSIMMVIAIAVMVFRRTSDPFGPFGSFIRSPAKRFKASDQKNTFDDVAGMESAKGELQEVVEFLKDPGKSQRLGAQIPKGVLLMGPPGTGKTLLARATAGEAGVPFYTINGSEFIQMFVGVGASRVRDMFKTAKDNSPCILFIDEIDAVGRHRGAGFGGGHDEREQTLNQILGEMDGFQQTEAVIVIAATNRPDVLDPALLRPGRFDRHVTVERPTKAGRVGVLKVHVRKVPLGDDVDLEKVAGGTIGFSGADLKNLVNEAALNATREGKQSVTMVDFDAARDRIVMGAKREDILNDKEREMTAFHEAGHALLGWLLPEVDPVQKVTIIPRGRALGVTMFMPEEERHSYGERQLHEQLMVLLGGRAAEKLVFDEFTAGAEDDLKRATSIARRMVGYWGMSDVVGPVAFRHGEEHPFLGKEIHEQREYSEETAHLIDQEIQRFLLAAQDKAIKLISAERGKLDTIAKALVEKEAVDHDDLVKLIGEQAPRTFQAKVKDK